MTLPSKKAIRDVAVSKTISTPSVDHRDGLVPMHLAPNAALEAKLDGLMFRQLDLRTNNLFGVE